MDRYNAHGTHKSTSNHLHYVTNLTFRSATTKCNGSLQDIVRMPQLSLSNSITATDPDWRLRERVRERDRERGSER